MSTNTLNSLLPLWLYVILKEKSAPKNPLSRKDIEKELKQNHHITIGEKDRNKLVRHIHALCDYFEASNREGAIQETTKTVKDTRGRSIAVPAWYLNAEKAPGIGGSFSVAEVNFLTDMVNDSQTISTKCTAALIHNLAASLSEGDRKEMRGKELEGGSYKNENTYLYEMKEKAEKAIDEHRQLTITYEVDGVEDYFAITPLQIDYHDGKCFIVGYRDNTLGTFFFDNIRFIDLWKEAPDHRDEEQTLFESEDSKGNKTITIALDALFSNTDVIGDAIHNKQYLIFSYYSYAIQNNKVMLTESDPKRVIPIKTAYKNGKPYLIAIDPQNRQPVFFRIDLMKDVRGAGRVDFMEYRKLDIKDTGEYTDKHPFMLSGFTKIRVTFLIKEDAIDRVIDAFGNKVTYLKTLKGYESAGKHSKKLYCAFPQLNIDHYFGFDPGDDLVEFTVETTDEEAVRFALQNGDAVELESPAPLRDRILEITAKMEARHKKAKKGNSQN